MQITTGIRQGCPLAPLLFIIALNPLYVRIEAASSLRGLQLETAKGEHQLKVAGYADDTALFLQSPGEIPAAMVILNEFATISGLRVNTAKSVGVQLNPAVVGGPDRVHGVPMLQPGASCRYLGIRVGAHDTHEENWRLCIQATAARIALAVAKTHTVKQRVQIAQAIIVSKIVFVARHMWPQRQTVKQLHSLIKAFVWGTRGGKVRRAWIKEQMAELPPHQGGIGMPHIYTALQQLSAKVVGQWATGEDQRSIFFGDILLCPDQDRPTHITPAHMSAVPSPRYQDSLWAMGKSVLAAAHQSAASPMLSSLTATHATSVSADFQLVQWQAEQLHFRASTTTMTTARDLAAGQRQELGRLNPHWLPLVDITAPGAL